MCQGVVKKFRMTKYKVPASSEGHSLGLDYLAVTLKDLHREQLSCCLHW